MRDPRLSQWHALGLAASLVLLMFLAGCRGGGPSAATANPSPDETLGPSPTLAFDCPVLVSETPQDAAAALKTAGFQISWRAVHTTSDGTPVADVVTVIPTGRIIDIILDGPNATVFVADPQDPAAQSPEPPTC
jgi:hypothetical protein